MLFYVEKAKLQMSKCDNCLEWEIFEGSPSGCACFCTQRTNKLDENEDCNFFLDMRGGKEE